MKLKIAILASLAGFLLLSSAYSQTQWTVDVDGGQNNLLNVKKLSVFKAATTASSAQNLLAWSEVLADGQGWTVQNLASDHNEAADGANVFTMEKISNNSLGSNAVYQQLDVDSAAGTYNFSWDVKKGTATNFLYAVYNLTSYYYLVEPTSYVDSTNTSSVTRMSITFTKPAGCKKIQVMPYAMPEDTLTVPNPTTGNLYLGRFQVRKTTYPATYVKTETNFQPGTTTGSTPAKYAIYTDDSSNVGINTTDTKGYKFAVNGDAVFNRAVVKLYANWPDYVFDKKYKLPSLKYVEAFVKTNGHLPGVPAAKQIEEQGIDIGTQQTVLMQKVEELTLYIIEQNKKIAALQQQVQQIKVQQQHRHKTIAVKK